MSTKLKLGVIGVGSMGSNHARIYSALPGVTLVGVSDINGARAREIAEKYNCSHFPDYRELLEKVDAVSIATPTFLHYETALEAISANTHVLMEKPFTTTSAEALDLIQKAQGKNLIIQVGFVDRYNAAVRKLKELVRHKKIIALEIRRLSPPIQRASDVSVVFDLMIHDIDHVLDFGNAKIKRLCAIGTYAYAVASFELENGIIANLTASKSGYTKIREFNISTTDSYFSSDMFKNEVSVTEIRLESKQNQYVNFGDLTTKMVKCEGSEPLKLELEEFVGCILKNMSPPAGAAEGLAALKVAGEIEKLCGLA